jgi:dipeptidyl aminopeptidase/acylaminoacyl peptidase
VKKRLLATSVALGAAAWLALQGSSALSPRLLTYAIQVHLPDGPHDAGLCIGRADGSQGVRLTPSTGDTDPAWSPDGRFLAFVNEGDIFVANAHGRNARNVTRGPSVSGDPAWSPDGLRIAYTDRSGGTSRIGLVNRDGSGRRFLSLNIRAQHLSQPAWSPDARQLLVISNTPLPQSQDLHIAQVDGTGSSLTASGATEPAWSPDGLAIAYVTGDGIMLANLGGGGTRLAIAGGASPAWSPDSQSIAFVRGGALLVSRVDGSRQRVVLRGPVAVADPAWRPASAQPAGSRRPCILTGTSRPDTIRGTSAPEVILGGAGADTIFAGGGDDIVLGDSGNDFVAGEAGADRLVGGRGRDRLYGGRGDDAFFALDAQRDLLDGGPGRDLGSYDVGLTDGTLDRRRSVELSRP